MKRFTSLMLMLLVAVTTWAGPTDLPTLTTDEANPVWYTISNTRSTSGKYIYWNGDNAEIQDANTLSGASFFYFTGTETNGVLTVKIHNFATDKLFASNNSWTDEGTDVTIGVTPHSSKAGLYIGFNGTYLNERNSNSGYTTWGADDAGSIFVMDLVTDFTSVIDVPAAKAAAIAELNNLATVSVIYPAATEAVAAIEAVTAAGTGLAELNAAIEAINKIVADYKTNAYKALGGKYYTINTPARGNGYLQMTTSKVVGTVAATTPANIWQFVENNGAVNIYNPYTGLYMCATAGSSAVVAVTDNQENAGAYTFTINTNAASEEAKVKIGVNGANVHVDGSSNLVRWDNGGASEFTITPVENFSTIISNYKTSTLATLDQWATLSVVFDASLINGAKTAINDINTNSFATIAAIDAEIKEVTDAVAAKMFTFQTLATDSHRENVWVSANPSTGKAIGLHGEHNYNSIWSLRHAGGVSFYMFNELNQVYMGAPSANCPLTETPSVAYTFEIIDAANGVVEMKCNGETMHASNHNDDKLLNWDGNENASRWYIRTIDVAADIQAILDGLTQEDYAVVPELGQYPTAAYEALVEARTSAKTVEEVEAAIAAFNKAKNRPVFTISGTKDYVVGKSLYEDEGNTNAKGNDCYFKTTNKYDKTMWWVFDQASTTVGVTESVAVVNYATGNPIWGVENLKITETDPVIENDGVFLFYSVGNNTPLHFQQDGSLLTRWGSYDAASGSAATFTYVGNTYELDQLTDEKIAALAALQAAYNSKALYANAVIGDGLGQYQGDKDAIVTALTAAEAIGSKTLAEQATLNVSDINDATTALNNVAGLTINMPAAGKYYRIQGACEASLSGYYITGHTNADGGRIALTADADASTIYYFDGTNLVAYQSGLVVGLNDSHWTFASIDDNSKPASTITFAQSPRTTGAYTVNSAGRYFHYTVYNNTVQVNRCLEDVCKEHDWYLTEVTELPVTISSVKHATFFAPVAVELPEGVGVKAHTVTINEGGWADLNEIKGGVIPANTGVILTGAEGAYDFAITTADALEGENLMVGTIAKTLVTKPENTECYVLANRENVVGMYAAAIGTGENVDRTKFYNAGHKAYLAVAGSANIASYSFRFGEGTTGISEVRGENGNVKAIYDLTGRRVEVITAPGIYIVNGKKVLVK